MEKIMAKKKDRIRKHRAASSFLYPAILMLEDYLNLKFTTQHILRCPPLLPTLIIP
jgi:hypothetical protein